MSAYKFSFPPTHPGEPKGGWCSSFFFFFFLSFFVNRIPGLSRDGKNWGGQIFLGGGVDQCEGQNLSRTPRFYPGSFEPVAKREDDPLGTYFCS